MTIVTTSDNEIKMRASYGSITGWYAGENFQLEDDQIQITQYVLKTLIQHSVCHNSVGWRLSIVTSHV